MPATSSVIPPALMQQSDKYRERILEAARQQSADDDTLESALATAFAQPDTVARLNHVLACSEWFAETATRHPHWLRDLIEANRGEPGETGLPDHAPFLDPVDSEPALLKALRDYRNRSQLQVIWRDLLRFDRTLETTANLTRLADRCITTASDYLYRQCCKEMGTPFSQDSGNEKGRQQHLLVIGMGKLGAGELNLSSDIDLIFTYPENGETRFADGDAATKTRSNQEFFIKLCQRLIQSLDKVTAEGFVFRVDMRLRPHGESGPLVANFASLENYYEKQGRNWERYAMVKARVICGPAADADELMAMLRPFTYRRYIDFTAIEGLRNMKAMINREAHRRDLKHNIKLGPGGIREIEFIAQAIQLIRGGRDIALQQRELMHILPLIAERGLIPAEAVDELIAAYYFLRNTEHALQAWQDQQTQQLPESAEDLLRLAIALGFEEAGDFMAELDRHRQNVREHFSALIAPAEEEHDPADSQRKTCLQAMKQLWLDNISEEEACHVLSHHGFDDAAASWQLLLKLKTDRVVLGLQAESRQRLNTLMPLLLETLARQSAENTDTPDATGFADRGLVRILPLVQAVLRRSAYLLLLIENPRALEQLVILSAASPWIAEQLAQHPVLLDELLDSRTLYTLPDREKLRDALLQQTLRIPPEDLEAHMDALRYFKRSHSLRVAACEVAGLLPLMKVSDYLTFLAEVILEHSLFLAWQHMRLKHGQPCNSEGELLDPGFIIIAYGKLGGLELGHSSDLDIVFVHDADTQQSTNGDKPIDNATFYARLGQRIIHILETRTPSGQLYEVDARLRPSGNSGMLVSSLAGFEKYQLNKAWTWEHQALVRARVVCGCPALAEKFGHIRAGVLAQQRDLPALQQDVREMREKMREHLGSKAKSGLFHIKHDAGAIVDIEFMVQYAVLAWAHRFPALLTYTDNIRILEQLPEYGILTGEEAQGLIDAYITLRSAIHRLALQQLSATVSETAFADERQQIRQCWQQLLDVAPAA